MFQSGSSFAVPDPWETAVTNVVRTLSAAAYEVLRSFDLLAARSDVAGCGCPQHEANPCTCQLIILLVYGKTGGYLTGLAQGYEQQIYFFSWAWHFASDGLGPNIQNLPVYPAFLSAQAGGHPSPVPPQRSPGIDLYQ